MFNNDYKRWRSQHGTKSEILCTKIYKKQP